MNALYDGGPFLRSLPNALAEAGIMIAQVGVANTIHSPSAEYSIDRNRVKFIETLVALGFPTVRDYEETHSGFEDPWQFVAAFKDFDYKVDWYANSAIVDLKIQQRAMMTAAGGSPFLHFDGATMKSYRYPSKGSEVAFCRVNPNVTDCANGHGFDLDREEVPLKSFEIRQSSLGEKAGRGVFAKLEVSSNSYIGLGAAIPSIHISPHAFETSNLLNKIPWVHSDYHGNKLETYANVYGHFFSRQVSSEKCRVIVFGRQSPHLSH